MRIVCISASNTKAIGINSTSTKVCNIIRDIIIKGDKEAFIDIVPLMDYEMKNCYLCGDCMKSGRCVHDAEFNRVYEKLTIADAIFIVIPHYSPIPSKLIMIFEKINEIQYSSWLNNPEYHSTLRNKPVGIIGHGGMVEDEGVLNYYHEHLITPVTDTLRSLTFDVVENNESFPNGVAFGLKDDSCIRTTKNSTFPAIIQDWPMIEFRVRPLVDNVIKKINDLNCEVK